MLGPEDASQKMVFLSDCKAKFGANELKTVGDKVCETRGAPKPASTAELLVASSCEPVTETVSYTHLTLPTKRIV